MKKYFPVLFVLGVAAAFVFGLLQLFKLRFEAGDVYPAYSSLRADPLGTMALYESLEQLPGISTRRDYSTANRLPDGKDTAYLHLAAPIYEWREMDKETFREIDQFLARGGRLVVTMHPASANSSRSRNEDETETNSLPEKVANPKDGKKTDDKKPAPGESKKKRSKKELEKDLEWVSLKDRWGMEFQINDLKKGDNDVYEPALVKNRTDLPLPLILDWHSGIVFTNVDKAWHIIYARGTNAVVIERKFGPGTVVVATDSYFLSNEAIQKDRHADFLAWLIGPGRNIIFDEAHLGVTERSGVAVLMRKYRLHWLAAGLILLAGLFIWKNSVTLAPPHAEETPTDYIAGKDAAAGFVNLLRRGIAPREVLSVSFAEWKKSIARGGKYSASRLQQAEAIFEAERALPPDRRDSLATYRKISSILKTRNVEPETKS
jgi:Domain of unknown function (DUF4350)